MIAFASDPLYKQHLPPGPMAEQAMSMRDPAFYRNFLTLTFICLLLPCFVAGTDYNFAITFTAYHTFIDNLFEKFKSKLAPYKVIGVSGAT